MKSLKPILTVFLVLSIALVILPHNCMVKAEPKTLVVPEDYSTIQEAIDNTAEGDTVFVKNGVYQVDENTSIVISKTLSLIGEDPANTMILGAFSMYPKNIAIRLAAPNITISGFTITNCRVAIAIVNYYGEPYPFSVMLFPAIMTFSVL